MQHHSRHRRLLSSSAGRKGDMQRSHQKQRPLDCGPRFSILDQHRQMRRDIGRTPHLKVKASQKKESTEVILKGEALDLG